MKKYFSNSTNFTVVYAIKCFETHLRCHFQMSSKCFNYYITHAHARMYARVYVRACVRARVRARAVCIRTNCF